MSGSARDDSAGDLDIGGSRSQRAVFSESPERLASSPASLRDGDEYARQNGADGDQREDTNLDDDREAAQVARLRARGPRRVFGHSEIGREEVAASSVDDVEYRGKSHGANAASENEPVDERSFERRPVERYTQRYPIRRKSSHDNKSEENARRRDKIPGQQDYWDDDGPEPSRNLGQDSFAQRERRFEHVTRDDGPRYVDRPWYEDRDIQYARDRRGRQRYTYGEQNPFEPRMRSEERVRPNLRTYNGQYGFADGRGRDPLLVPSDLRRMEMDEERARPRYMPPTGRAGEPLKVDIKSTPATKDEQIPPLSGRPLPSEILAKQSLKFEISCGTTNSAGLETVYLTQKSPKDPLGATHLRWIHKQESCLSIEGFQDFLVSAGLSQTDFLMTSRLLRQVEARAQKEFNHSYILDPLVIRGDTVQVPDKKNHEATRHDPVVNKDGVPGQSDHYQGFTGPRARAPDRHCTFVNFPYFSLQALETDRGKDLKYRPPRGLLQTLYRLESTASREKEQAICKDHIIITYSPHFLSDLTGQSILIRKSLAAVRSNPSILKVTDVFQKTLFFSLDQCRSCEYTHTLLIEHGTSLDALMWQRMIKASENPVISLLIEEKGIQYPRYRESDNSDSSADVAFTRARNVQIYPAQDRFIRPESRRAAEDNTGATYDGSPYGNVDNGDVGMGYRSVGRRATYSPSRYNNDQRGTIARQPETYYRTPQITNNRDNLYGQNNFIMPYSNEAVTGQGLTAGNPLLLREAEPVPTRAAYAAAYVPSTLQRSATMNTDIYRNRRVPHLAPAERRNESRPVEPNYRFYHSARRPPAPDGIINNHVPDDAENDMYFVPRIARRVTGGVETSPRVEFRGARSRRGSQTRDFPTKKRHSSESDGIDKSNMIPIFLWPTGYPDSTENVKDWAGIWDAATEIKTTKSIEEKIGGGSPPRRASSKRPSQLDNTSLSTVLESVVDSFADSSQPSKLFRSMPNADAKECFPGREGLKPVRPKRQDESVLDAVADKAVADRQNPLQDDAVSTADSSTPSDHRTDGKELGNKKTIHAKHDQNERRIRQLIAAQNEAILRRPAVPRPTFIVQDIPSSGESSSAEAEDSDGRGAPPDKAKIERKLSAELDDQVRDDKDDKSLEVDSTPQSVNDFVAEDRNPPYQTNAEAEGHQLLDDTAGNLGSSIHLRERDALLLKFVDISQRLLGKYIPSDNSSVVTMKYFGTIKSCVELVQSLHDDCLLSKNKSTDVWIIDDVNLIVHKYSQALPRPSWSLIDCDDCRSRMAYRTEDEASQHLIRVHFRDVEITRDQARLWIKQESRDVEKREQYQQILIMFNKCHRILQRAEKKVQAVQESVFTSDDQLRSCYRLPNTIVESFCTILKVLLWTSSALARASKNIKSQSRDLVAVNEIREASYHLRSLGRKLFSELNYGKNDLMEMARLQQQSRGIKIVQEIGPHYVLAMVLSNLQLGVNCEDLIDVYEKYIDRLSFQANQFPRRRLIRSFVYLDEETKIIYETISRQFNLLTDLWQVIDPTSFKTTTESRVSMFDLENELIKKTQGNIDVKRADLLEMEFQIERLIQQTKTSLEIKDDDHGKAILVFTIVTLIFLPLSFVSSFLGMNTVDIRDMNSNQTLFWAVAIPVTAGVMVLALVIGYKLEAIRGWFEKRMGKSKVD